MLRQIKRRLGGLVYGATAVPATLRLDDAARGRPTVVGFFRTPSGIGQSARLCYAALQRLGFEPYAIDLSPRFQPAGMLPPFLGDSADNGERGPVIIHANPPELPAVTSFLGRRFLGGRMIVGYWAWELARMPHGWTRAFRYVHEIWAPSSFCADLFRAHTAKPVRLVFHSLPPIDEPADRPAFGIPAGAVAFLAACDLRSSMSRKNPRGAIRAFREAFGTARDRHLLLKITGFTGNERLLDVLRREVGDSPNISLWTTPLSPQVMHRLYASVDCVLSLHRAEGFGLIMVEGMLAGRCVIGTAWPGCSDFLTPSTALTVHGTLVPVEDPQGIYGGDQRWMEPDAESAARLLRMAATDANVRLSIADAGRRHAVALFSDERYAASLGAPFRDRTPTNCELTRS